MASHGGDGGDHGWDRPPGTVPMGNGPTGNAPPGDDAVTLDDGKPMKGTIRNWAPGAAEPEAPATIPKATKPYGTAMEAAAPSFDTLDHEATTRRVAAVVDPDAVLSAATPSPAPATPAPATPAPATPAPMPASPQHPATRTLISEGAPLLPEHSTPLPPPFSASSPPGPTTERSAVQPQPQVHSVPQPSAVQPSAAQPSLAQPSAAQPSVVQPSVVQPSAEWPPRPSGKRRRGKAGLIVATVVCVAGGAFAAGWLMRPGDDPEAEGEPTPTTEPATTAEPEATAPPSAEPESTAQPESTAEPQSTAESTAAPESTAEPQSTAESTAEPQSTAEPESTAEPVASADPPAPPPADRKPLSYEGYLVVQSSAKADVYVQGKLVGATNETLIARCYSKFVRLKSEDRWITAGQPVMITCMETTTVRIDPD